MNRNLERLSALRSARRLLLRERRDFLECCCVMRDGAPDRRTMDALEAAITRRFDRVITKIDKALR